MNEEVKTGQIWKWKKSTRPDVEIISYNKYDRKVYWHYIGEKTTYDNDIYSFLENFETKT